MDSNGNHSAPYSKVSPNLEASGIFPVGMVLYNWAVEHSVAAFSSFPLLYGAGEDQAEASNTSNSANLMSSC